MCSRESGCESSLQTPVELERRLEQSAVSSLSRIGSPCRRLPSGPASAVRRSGFAFGLRTFLGLRVTRAVAPFRTEINSVSQVGSHSHTTHKSVHASAFESVKPQRRRASASPTARRGTYTRHIPRHAAKARGKGSRHALRTDTSIDAVEERQAEWRAYGVPSSATALLVSRSHQRDDGAGRSLAAPWAVHKDGSRRYHLGDTISERL